MYSQVNTIAIKMKTTVIPEEGGVVYTARVVALRQG